MYNFKKRVYLAKKIFFQYNFFLFLFSRLSRSSAFLFNENIFRVNHEKENQLNRESFPRSILSARPLQLCTRCILLHILHASYRPVFLFFFFFCFFLFTLRVIASSWILVRATTCASLDTCVAETILSRPMPPGDSTTFVLFSSFNLSIRTLNTLLGRWILRIVSSVFFFYVRIFKHFDTWNIWQIVFEYHSNVCTLIKYLDYSRHSGTWRDVNYKSSSLNTSFYFKLYFHLKSTRHVYFGKEKLTCLHFSIVNKLRTRHTWYCALPNTLCRTCLWLYSLRIIL